MVKNFEMDVEGKTVTAVEVALPGAPLVLVAAAKGFVMCGYLSVEAAAKLGVAAVRVRGVKTVDDLLKAPVDSASEAALQLGVTAGMLGRDALKKLL